MLQRWMSCTKCGWEWATIEQRNHNQSSYKNKSEYRRFDFTEHEWIISFPFLSVVNVKEYTLPEPVAEDNGMRSASFAIKAIGAMKC